MDSARLGSEVFIALAAVGWADGQLDADESDAIVRAAAEEGLSIEEIAAVEAATQTRVELSVLDRLSLGEADRLFVHAVATWIARLDGQVTGDESHALDRLSERLGLPKELRARAERAARELAAMPDGDRPARYDLVALRQVLSLRMRAS